MTYYETPGGARSSPPARSPSPGPRSARCLAGSREPLVEARLRATGRLTPADAAAGPGRRADGSFLTGCRNGSPSPTGRATGRPRRRLQVSCKWAAKAPSHPRSTGPHTAAQSGGQSGGRKSEDQGCDRTRRGDRRGKGNGRGGGADRPAHHDIGGGGPLQGRTEAPGGGSVRRAGDTAATGLRLAREAVPSPASGARLLRRSAHRRNPKGSVEQSTSASMSRRPTALLCTRPPTAWPSSTGRGVVTIRRATARSSRTGTSGCREQRSARDRVPDDHRPHHQGLGPRAFRRAPRRHVRQSAAPGRDGAVCDRTCPAVTDVTSSAAGIARPSGVRGRSTSSRGATTARNERPGALARAARDAGAHPMAHRRRQRPVASLARRPSTSARASRRVLRRGLRRRDEQNTPDRPGYRFRLARGLDAAARRRVSTRCRSSRSTRAGTAPGRPGRSSSPLNRPTRQQMRVHRRRPRPRAGSFASAMRAPRSPSAAGARAGRRLVVQCEPSRPRAPSP